MANRKHPKAEDYSDDYEGHVQWHVDWLRYEGEVSPELMTYGNEDAMKIVASNFEECARIMEGQVKAIQIVQTMMDEMYAANPTPRMKALKAAIEAIYVG